MPSVGLPSALFSVVAMVLALTPAVDVAQAHQGNRERFLSIAISRPQNVVICDAEAPLDVTITNTSNSDQPGFGPFSGPLWLELYRIDILDSDGNPAREKPILKRIRGQFPIILADNGTFQACVRTAGGPLPPPFKAGEQWRSQVPLNRLYELSKPGKYTIQVQMGGAKSNIITASFVGAAAPAGGAKPAFSMTLSSPYNTLKAGSDVPVEITVKNISNHEISLAVWNGRRDSGPLVDSEFGTGITVSGATGNTSPLTEFGRAQLLDDDMPNGLFAFLVYLHRWRDCRAEDALPQGMFTLLRMTPGESRQERKVAGRLYDLSKPGVYAVQASLLDPTSHLRVNSNKIMITITE